MSQAAKTMPGRKDENKVKGSFCLQCPEILIQEAGPSFIPAPCWVVHLSETNCKKGPNPALFAGSKPVIKRLCSKAHKEVLSSRMKWKRLLPFQGHKVTLSGSSVFTGEQTWPSC